MGYYVATTSSIFSRMVDLDADSLTTVLVSDCITDAEAEVNKWLSRRYDLTSYQTTTATIPPLMVQLTTRLAEAYTWQRSSRGAKESLTRGDNLEKKVLENLKALANNEANLIDSTGAVIADSSENSMFQVKCSSLDYKPTFNEGKSTSWVVDEDKLDDIDDGNY